MATNTDIALQRQVAWLEGQLTTLARLSEQQRLFEICESLEKKMISIYEEFGKYVPRSELQKEQQDILSALKIELAYHAKFVNELSANIDKLTISEMGLSSDCERIDISISQHEEKIKNISSIVNQCANKSELNQATKQLSEDHAITKSKVEFNHQRSSDRISLIESKVRQLSDSLDRIQASSEKMINQIAQWTKQSSDTLQNLKTYFDISLSELGKKMEQRFAALPKPEPFSPEKLKQEIETKYEQMVTDTKNACLRATNADLKMSVLEKKLEQAFLLIENKKLSK